MIMIESSSTLLKLLHVSIAIEFNQNPGHFLIRNPMVSVEDIRCQHFQDKTEGHLTLLPEVTETQPTAFNIQ